MPISERSRNRAVWIAICTMMIPAPAALATDLHYREFDDAYARADSPSSAALAAALAERKCNVCHAGDRKRFNAYGAAMKEAPRQRGEKVAKSEKVRAAFEHAAGLRSVADDSRSPTFGELLRQGRLPLPGPLAPDESIVFWDEGKAGGREDAPAAGGRPKDNGGPPRSWSSATSRSTPPAAR